MDKLEQLKKQMLGAKAKMDEYESKIKIAQLRGNVDEAYKYKKLFDEAKRWFGKWQNEHKKIYFNRQVA